MVTAGTPVRPAVAFLLVMGALLLALAATQLVTSTTLGRTGTTTHDQPAPALRPAGPEDAGPEIVRQPSSGGASTKQPATSAPAARPAPAPQRADTNPPPVVKSGGIEDAGLYQPPASYSSTGCGPRPCQP